MKLLASAYMKRFPLPQSQNRNNNTVTPKQEVVPVDITPGKKNEVSPINDLSIAQLRRLLAKPGQRSKINLCSYVRALKINLKKHMVSMHNILLITSVVCFPMNLHQVLS